MRVSITLWPVFFLIFLVSCTSRPVAPVDTRAAPDLYRAAPVTSYDPEPVTKGFHEVVQGDTLYSISWRYGLDYRDVAAWNNISGNYVIYPGQRIRLIPDPSRPTVAVSPTPPANRTAKQNTGPVTIKPPTVQSTQTRTSPIINQPDIQWRWPTTGSIVRSDTPIAQKGLNITGREGQNILAAANGVVVYSGSGLLGYGKLIIVKHNDTFLSAYAHNQEMLVKEGDTVKGGQNIGTMGRSGRGQPLLHFEIRREGKPVNPLLYLPAQS